MLGLILTILQLVLATTWLGGMAFFTPRFAAIEANNRGRLYVHRDDVVFGAARAAGWPVLLGLNRAQHAANEQLGKLPGVQAQRGELSYRRQVELMEQSITTSLSLDRELGTPSTNDEETHSA